MLEPDLCRALIERWETMGHEEGKVQSVLDGLDHERVDFEGKRRLDHYINDNGLTRELGLRVLRRLAPEIEKATGSRAFVWTHFLSVATRRSGRISFGRTEIIWRRRTPIECLRFASISMRGV